VGNYKDKDNIVFQVGDFVVDIKYNEIGLLLMRFNLMDDAAFPIYGWDIMWSGYRYSLTGQPRRAPYTEESLKNMIVEGVLKLYKK
tara:strand:+ start:34 stop:291 length:258 start_codon:yes stop_codon:yes gene_type:complete